MTKKRYVPDLIEAMADCDANYIRLMKLFGWDSSSEKVVFGVPGTGSKEMRVTISVTEKCPYTTMVNLRIQAHELTDWLKWPAMEIRVYHDVRSAEVVSCAEHRRLAYRYDYPNPKMYQPDEKAQVNKHLGEFLTYCLSEGHSLVDHAKDTLPG